MRAGGGAWGRLAAIVLVALAGAAAAAAAGLEPQPAFRRVAVPAPGSTAPRITVQIARLAVPSGAEREPPLPDPGPPEDSLADVAPTGPGDLETIARRHGPVIGGATRGTIVPPSLVLAVIATESSGRSDAVSVAGAAGLMQLMAPTAARFGVTDRFNPAQNIRGGVAYLDWLLREFGDTTLALAAYNAGEGAVRRHGGVPRYAETQAYVPKVLAAWQAARTLCRAADRPGEACLPAGL